MQDLPDLDVKEAGGPIDGTSEFHGSNGDEWQRRPSIRGNIHMRKLPSFLPVFSPGWIGRSNWLWKHEISKPVHKKKEGKNIN